LACSVIESFGLETLALDSLQEKRQKDELDTGIQNEATITCSPITRTQICVYNWDIEKTTRIFEPKENAMSLEDALLSLQGLSVGDAFGECFFSHSYELVERRELPPPPWRWTDDTHMAVSIVEVLQKHGGVDQDILAQAFALRFRQESWRGYGSGARHLLSQISKGADWRKAAPALFGGGSFGNGGAMRVAPIGGFFAGQPPLAAVQARLSAEITHAHPEGQAGAMAVAAAAAFAARPDHPSGTEFIQAVLDFVPEGLTRQGIQQALEIPPDAFERAVEELGTGAMISAQDTVPFCLWSAAHHLDDYEAALWQTVAGLGDRDTTCAIVGGIVALSARGTPAEWLARREPLPKSAWILSLR
jgi:ADP-ribosylglycohydrolase